MTRREDGTYNRRMTARLRASALVLGALWGVTTGCPEETFNQVDPRIVAEPAAVDFGAGIIDRDNVFALNVANRGPGLLTIDRFEIVRGGDVFSVDAAGLELATQQEVSVDVVFVPTTPKAEYTGALVIFSNDPLEPELQVDLQGVGGIREIEVVPTSVDFGVVNEGTRPTRTIEIRNIGGDPLVLDRLTWTSTSVDLVVDTPLETPWTVEALTSTAVVVAYAPEDLGADAGLLTIHSNDEDEPEIEVPVRARANLAPRAVAWICDKAPGETGCAPEDRVRSISAGLGSLLGLDGRDTVDPEGGEVDGYRWRLVEQPEGLEPFLFPDSGPPLGITAEAEIRAVGRHVYRLVAVDDRGLESLDREESRVIIRPRDLEVFVTWDIATDADLHLVRPGGTVGDYGNGRVGTSTGSDCSTFNRAPNWGDPARSDDDPRLEADVVSGRGPEVVSLDFPEAGEYVAYLHYCDSRNVNTNLNAFLEVFVRGVPVARLPMMDGRRVLPGELWEAARISWVDGEAVVTEGTAPVQMRPELCRTE